MRTFFANSWLCGLRSRSFQAVFILGVLLIGVAFLAGFFSPRQPKTVALDVGLSGLRFSLVLLSLFWVQELVGKEIERRTVFFVLTYPVPRSDYVVGRYLGILALAAVAVLMQGLLLWLVVLVAGGQFQQQFMVSLGLPYWVALLGIWLDVAVVTAFTLWIATLSTVPILPLALGAAFAIGGKSLGPVRDYLAQGAEGDKALVATYQPMLDSIQWVLPDLSRLDWRLWPMYGQAPEAGPMLWGAVMAVGYAALMLFFAVRQFARREFS
jgi:ABC-type transport system involved in multi-copper enzyme maturation permease subunit